jgi:hypothetical protein
MNALNCTSVDYNKLDEMGMSPLHHVCASRGLDLARTPIDLASLSIEAGTTKILKTEDRLKVINFLLDNRAEIDIKASNGKTALHFACYNGYVEIIDLLLERGADTTITCPEPFYDDWGMLSASFDLPAQGLGVAYGHHNILLIFEKHGKLTTGAVVGRYS